jgi:hypothetical protein
LSEVRFVDNFQELVHQLLLPLLDILTAQRTNDVRVATLFKGSFSFNFQGLRGNCTCVSVRVGHQQLGELDVVLRRVLLKWANVGNENASDGARKRLNVLENEFIASQKDLSTIGIPLCFNHRPKDQIGGLVRKHALQIDNPHPHGTFAVEIRGLLENSLKIIEILLGGVNAASSIGDVVRSIQPLQAV